MQSKHNSIYKIKYTNATFRGLIYAIPFDYLRLYLVYRDDLKKCNGGRIIKVIEKLLKIFL